MPSFTRWAMATTHTPWQAITVRGSSGRLADLVVQRKSAGSGMAGRIRRTVADPANVAATCLNRSESVPARRCSRAPGLSCLRPRIGQGQDALSGRSPLSGKHPLTFRVLLCGQLVLVEPVPLVVKDPVQRCQVGRVRIEPGVHVLWLDVDDGPIVASSSHLGLRVVGDSSERHQARPVANQTSDTIPDGH